MPEPRVAPVTEPSDELRALLGRTLPTPDGEPLNLFSTLAHHPLLLRRVMAFGETFLGPHSTLPPRDRELVILRVAIGTDCAYERTHHEAIGRRAGLDTELDRLALPLDDPEATWSPHDRVLLELVDELLAAADVDDQTWAAVAAGRSEAELLELIALVGFYRLLAGLLRASRVQVDAQLADI